MSSREIEAFQENKVLLWGEKLADPDLLKKYDKGNKNPYSINTSLSKPTKKTDKQIKKTSEPEPEKPKKNKARVFDPEETYIYDDIEWLNKQIEKKNEEEEETDYGSEESDKLLKEIDQIEKIIKRLEKQKYDEEEAEWSKPKSSTSDFEKYDKQKDEAYETYMETRKGIYKKYKATGKEFVEYEDKIMKELNDLEEKYKKQVEKLDREYTEATKPPPEPKREYKSSSKSKGTNIIPEYVLDVKKEVGRGLKAGTPEAKLHSAKMRAKKLGLPPPDPADFGIGVKKTEPTPEPKQTKTKSLSKSSKDYTQDEIDALLDRMETLEDKFDTKIILRTNDLMLADDWKTLTDLLDTIEFGEEVKEEKKKSSKSRVDRGSDEAKEKMAKLTAIRQEKARLRREAEEAEKQKKQQEKHKNKKPWFYIGDIPVGYREATEDEAIMNKKVSVYGKYKVDKQKYFFYETYGINISENQKLHSLNIGISATKKQLSKCVEKLNTLYIHYNSPKYFDKQSHIEADIYEQEERLSALEKGINILLKLKAERTDTDYKPYEYAPPDKKEKAEEPMRKVEEVKEEKKEMGKREMNNLYKKFDQIPFDDPRYALLKKKYIDTYDPEGLKRYFMGEEPLEIPTKKSDKSKSHTFYNDEGEKQKITYDKDDKIDEDDMKKLFEHGIILPKEYYTEYVQSKYFFYPKQATETINVVNTFKASKQPKTGSGIVLRKPDTTNDEIVQSVVFEKDYWTPGRAKQWLKKNGYYNDDIDDKPTQLRFRQFNPDDLKNYYYISKPLKEKHILLIIAMSTKKPRTPKTKKTDGGDLIHIDVGSHNNEPKHGDGIMKPDTDSDEDNLEKKLSEPVIHPEVGEGLKKKKTRKPKTPKTPKAKKSSTELSETPNSSLKQLLETTEKKKEKKYKEALLNTLSNIAEHTGQTMAHQILGGTVKPSKRPAKDIEPGKTSSRPLKGSEEAKEWARKMREAREAKKSIKA